MRPAASWRGLACVALASALLLVAVDSSEADAASAAWEEANEEFPIASFPLKVLRKMLDDRGVQCKGCYEKSDFVDKLKETIHLPLKGASAPKQNPQGAKGAKAGGGGAGARAAGGMSKEHMQTLMGGENIQRALHCGTTPLSTTELSTTPLHLPQGRL